MTRQVGVREAYCPKHDIWYNADRYDDCPKCIGEKIRMSEENIEEGAPLDNSYEPVPDVKAKVSKIPEDPDPRLVPPPGKLVLKRVAEEKVGHLYLPDTARDRSALCKVIATYTSFEDPDTGGWVEPFYREGNYVIIGQHGGVTVDIHLKNERAKFVVVREKEILCRVDNLKEDK